jgi:hypothetical protein
MALFHGAGLPVEQLAALDQASAPWFAEGRRLEAEGRYDEAFAAFAEGNRVKAQVLDPANFVARHGALVKLLKSVVTRDFLRQHAANNRDESPIFIVGVPRSGSTLVEQILCSHPAVQGLGEIQSLMRLLSGAFPFRAAGSLDPPGAAAAYLEAVKAEGWSGRPRFTDKRLINAVAIGHIHLMFPRATVINCTRDPLDTAVSCFRSDFSAGGWTRFSYDLAGIGRYYALHREIMSHWNFVLMGRVINVEYEALVLNPETRIRALVESCRLPWNDACLSFFENPREVFTVGADQVRRPMFQDSIGRWRRFAPHLGPLIQALGPYAPAEVGAQSASV